MALTPSETAILDRLEAGQDPRQIVAAGFSEAKVKFVLGTYGTDDRNAYSDRRRDELTRRGSRQLLAAIRRELGWHTMGGL